MDDMHDDAKVATAVAAVWRKLEPAVERHLAPRVPGRSRSPRRRRAVVAGVIAGAFGAGGVVLARSTLGDPAPPPIQRSISAIDEGMPADLRFNPDVRDARSVARDGDAVLYAADLADGGVCTELAVGGKPGGATCRPARSAAMPIEASIPDTSENAGAPVVVGGRVNVDADQVTVVVAGDLRIPATLSPGGYFVATLDAAESAAARQQIAIRATSGPTVVATLDLSAAFDSANPSAHEAISLEMVTGAGDLSTVASINGSVDIPGATAVQLVFPDGTSTEPVALMAGRYEVVLPADRQGDLAAHPGRLVVVDATGHQLANRSVAAVSWWRGHDTG